MPAKSTSPGAKAATPTGPLPQPPAKPVSAQSWAEYFMLIKGRSWRHRLTDNVTSGVTVALVNVPLSIALSIAGGGTPVMGVITAFWAGLVSSTVGASHYNIVGPTGALSGILNAAVLRHKTVAVLPLLSLYSAAVLAVCLALRLDKVMRYVSTPVAHGFAVAVALIIALSQVGNAFNLQNLQASPSFFGKVGAWFTAMPTAAAADSFFFAANLAALLTLSLKVRRVPWAIVFALVGIVIGATAPAGTFELLGAKYPNIHFRLVDVDDALPQFRRLLTQADLYATGVAVAVVALLESLISADIGDRAAKETTPRSSARETLGLTVANLCCGLFGGLPATAALARTSMNINAGAWSRLSGLISSLTSALLAVVLLPFFDLIPMATVAAMLMVVAYRLVDWHELALLYRYDTAGMHSFITTLAACLLFDTFSGLAIGAAIAIALDWAHVHALHCEIHHDPAVAHGCVVVVHSDVLFVNCQDFADMVAGLELRHRDVTDLVLDFSAASSIDFDGSRAVSDAVRRWRKANRWRVTVRATTLQQRILTMWPGMHTTDQLKDEARASLTGVDIDDYDGGLTTPAAASPGEYPIRWETTSPAPLPVRFDEGV